MLVNPGTNEKRDFLEQGRKLLLGAVGDLQAAIASGAKQWPTERPFIDCPKCGKKLVVETCADAPIDDVRGCKGLWLDTNQLAMTMEGATTSGACCSFLTNRSVR